MRSRINYKGLLLDSTIETPTNTLLIFLINGTVLRKLIQGLSQIKWPLELTGVNAKFEIYLQA